MYGSPYAPSIARRGRPQTLTVAQQDQLLLYLEDRPTAVLDEIALFAREQFGVQITNSTLPRLLKRLGWSYKVAKKVAMQRSKPLRAAWRVKRFGWSNNRLVFLDETAASCLRAYG